MTWTDAAGNLWMFGGYGFPIRPAAYGYLSDLWEYKTSTNEWTWINGSSTSDTASNYGTLGVAAAGNAPGGRYVRRRHGSTERAISGYSGWIRHDPLKATETMARITAV